MHAPLWLSCCALWATSLTSQKALGHQTPVDGLSQAIEQLLDAPALSRAQVGIDIVRMDDGVRLFGHQSEHRLIPASNVKLLTTAAALSYLSPDFQFFTDVYGQMDANGRITGDLILHGDGDPYLIPERIWYLASRLSFLGVRDIAGDIVVDDSYFAGDRMALGSEQDRSSAAYMAPMGAVSVGFNALMVHVAPGPGAGQPARITIDPVSDYAQVAGSVHTVATGRTHVQVSVVANGNKGSIVQVSGRIRLSDTGRAFWRRIDNPPLFAASVMRTALTQVGISVKGGSRTGAVPPNTPRLVQYGSPRLAELLVPLNKYSSNFMATQLALALGAKRFGAPGTWDKARQAIEAFLADEVRIPRGSYVLNNASGLHDVNALSPHQIVQVLSYMQRQPQLSFEFITSLAVGASSGTLQDRMLVSPAAHLVRAKTGTLQQASALSGYVTTRDHRTLAFSFLVNHYRHIHEVWAAQDKFAAILADLDLSRSDHIAAGTPLFAPAAPAVSEVAEDAAGLGAGPNQNPAPPLAQEPAR